MQYVTAAGEGKFRSNAVACNDGYPVGGMKGGYTSFRCTSFGKFSKYVENMCGPNGQCIGQIAMPHAYTCKCASCADLATEMSRLVEETVVADIVVAHICVKDCFDVKEPNRGINPDEVAAYGAAVPVGILSGEGGQDLLLLDVTDSCQSEVNIQVFEGERHMSKDSHMIGKSKKGGIPPAPRGATDRGFRRD